MNQKYLLENKHGSCVVVKPNRDKNSNEEKALEEKLAAYKESLSEDEINELIQATYDLKKYQEEPSSEEDLLKLPMLTRDDLKKTSNPFSNIEDCLEGVKIVRHDYESNGIDYLSLMFNIKDFDFEKDLITIDRRLEYHGVKKEELYTVGKLKTKKSKAVIPLASKLKEGLNFTEDKQEVNSAIDEITTEQGINKIV